MISSCMQERAQRSANEHALAGRLTSEWTENQTDIYTLDQQDLTGLWIDTHRANGQNNEQIITRFEELNEGLSLTLGEQSYDVINKHGATAVNAARDGRTLAVLGNDMRRSGNVLGRFEIRPRNGRDYIVFKGNHTLRHVVRGTRYSLSNPTIIKMGIGTDGLRGAAKGGVLVTLVVSATVNTYGWIFDESMGWKEFLLNVSADLVKAAIAAAAGYFIAKGFAAATGMIVLANGLGFFIGLYVGWKVAPITFADISALAQKTSFFYNQSVTALSHPSAFLSAQKLKVHDFVICTAEATGSAILGSIQQRIDNSVSDFLYKSSPLYIR